MKIFSKMVGDGYIISPIYTKKIPKILYPRQEEGFTYTDFKIFGKSDCCFGWITELNSTIPFNNGIMPGMYFTIQKECTKEHFNLTENLIETHKLTDATCYKIHAWMKKSDIKKMQKRTTVASSLLFEKNNDMKEILGISDEYRYFYEDPSVLEKFEENKFKIKLYLQSVTNDYEFCLWVVEGTIRQFQFYSNINMTL